MSLAPALDDALHVNAIQKSPESFKTFRKFYCQNNLAILPIFGKNNFSVSQQIPELDKQHGC